MAARLSSADARKMLLNAFDAVEPDQVYHGSMIQGRYRYHGMGNRQIEFQPIDNSDPARFTERMTGRELAAAIGAEIDLDISNKNAARRAVGLPEIDNDVWTEASPNGLATNTHPLKGGIIDNVMGTDEWFVIFNRNDLPMIDGLDSREEAFRVFEERLRQVAEDEPTVSAPGF